MLEEVGFVDVRVGAPADTFGGASGEKNARRFEVYGYPFLARKPEERGGKEWESNPPGTSKSPSLDLKSRRPTGMRISSGRDVAQQHVLVARAAREFYPIEELEDLDGEVAADLRAVAKRRRGDGAARTRLFRGDLLQTLDHRRQEEAVLGYAHEKPLARQARQRRLEPGRVLAQARGELGGRRRTQRRLLKAGPPLLPQPCVCGTEFRAMARKAQARAFARHESLAHELLDQPCMHFRRRLGEAVLGHRAALRNVAMPCGKPLERAHAQRLPMGWRKAPAAHRRQIAAGAVAGEIHPARRALEERRERGAVVLRFHRPQPRAALRPGAAARGRKHVDDAPAA